MNNIFRNKITKINLILGRLKMYDTFYPMVMQIKYIYVELFFTNLTLMISSKGDHIKWFLLQSDTDDF